MAKLPFHQWPSEFAAIGYTHSQQIAAIKATALISDYLDSGTGSFRSEIKTLAELTPDGLDFDSFASAVNRCLGRTDDAVAWLLLRQHGVFSCFRGLEDRGTRQAIKAHLGPRPDWNHHPRFWSGGNAQSNRQAL